MMGGARGGSSPLNGTAQCRIVVSKVPTHKRVGFLLLQSSLHVDGLQFETFAS